MRHYSLIDQVIGRFDKILQALPNNNACSPSPFPMTEPEESAEPLSRLEQKQSAALMRINHTGEVCAQALYLGQALVARNPHLAEELYQAATEEKAHLAWCAERIDELEAKRSFLNPLFAMGSFGMGVLAGLCSDKVSLGFLAETEQQVTQHLEKHLQEISENDLKSRAILTQMKCDEEKHSSHALQSGGIPLHNFIKKSMRFFSTIMTSTTRYI